jgi:hypothetical protein
LSFSRPPAPPQRHGIQLAFTPDTFDGGYFGDETYVDESDFDPSFSYELGGCACHGRLPSAWRARGDLPQHQPYDASPKTYYYFRAYTHIHMSAILDEASLHGASRANPYDTNVFEGVYDALAKELAAEANAAAEPSKANAK